VRLDLVLEWMGCMWYLRNSTRPDEVDELICCNWIDDFEPGVDFSLTSSSLFGPPADPLIYQGDVHVSFPCPTRPF